MRTKVLVVSANAFSKIGNNGKTLEAIFSAFDRSELSQLFFRPPAANSYDYSYAMSYFHLSDMDIVKAFSRGRGCGRVIESSSTPLDISKNSKYYQKVKNPTSSLNVILRDVLWKLPIWKRGDLLEWARLISPDAIFVYLGGGRYMYDVVSFLSKQLRIPYFVFYGDDYVLYAPKRSILDKIQNKRCIRYYKKAIGGALDCFCIGDLMAKEYSDFFGKPFYPIMNSVPVSSFEPRNNVSGIVSMSYLGGLHLNRWKMLQRIADHIPCNSIIHIYSGTELNDEMKSALNHPRIILHGLIPQSEVEKVMRNSDVLLHVESDEDSFRNYTHLSVSTKIPEYLMAGRLILAYGPPEVASMRLISDNRLGIVISSDCKDSELSDQISQICCNPEIIDSYGRKAHSYATSVFDQRLVADFFRRKIEKDLESTMKE